jgi:hypothetical protein
MTEIRKKPILSLCATTRDKLKDLAVKNGQLIFMPESRKIALDYEGKRTFYNQITELQSEEEREAIENPENGTYYFVIKSAVLWTYYDEWIAITSAPAQVLFIGTELPELGSDNKLYINKEKKNISVWDKETGSYLIVGEKYEIVSENEIDLIF